MLTKPTVENSTLTTRKQPMKPERFTKLPNLHSMLPEKLSHKTTQITAENSTNTQAEMDN